MEYRAIYADEPLAHHGIKGQKWGVRRFQNPDGSLTSLGKKRYAGKSYRLERSAKIHEGAAATADKLRVPSAAVAGTLLGTAAGITTHGVATTAGLYTYTTFSMPAATAVGLIGAGVVYGGYTGVKAVESFIAKQKRKKVSEIDAMIEKS